MDKGLVGWIGLPKWACWMALFAASGLLAIIGLTLSAEIKGVSSTQQPLFDRFAAVCGPHTQGQSFVATEPNLNRVDLWLAWIPPQPVEESVAISTARPAGAPGQEQATAGHDRYRVFLPLVTHSPEPVLGFPVGFVLNTEGCELASSKGESTVVVSLKQDAASSEVIAAAAFRLDSLENPATRWRRPYAFQSLTFPPIPDSAGRAFLVTIEAPSSSASGPLLARYHHADLYADGSRYLDGESTSGDLAFRLHYQAVPSADTLLLLSRVARHRAFPFDRAWFYLLLLAIYVGLFAVIIKDVAEHLSNPQN